MSTKERALLRQAMLQQTVGVLLLVCYFAARRWLIPGVQNYARPGNYFAPLAADFLKYGLPALVYGATAFCIIDWVDVYRSYRRRLRRIESIY